MIKLYIAGIEGLSDKDCFMKYESMIDDARREKLRQCRKEEDKKRSLLAGYLIQLGVKERLYMESGLQAEAAPLSLSYIYGENGKPYLKEYGNIFFSLSHSGNYVLCAFSEREIGADIQEHRSVKEGLADRFFSKADKQLMERLGTDAGFYDIWSVKEAFMKLTGEGMQQGLSATQMIPDKPETGMTVNSSRHRLPQAWKRGIIEKTEDGSYRQSRKNDSAHFILCDTIDSYSIAVCSYEKAADIDSNMVKIM